MYSSRSLLLLLFFFFFSVAASQSLLQIWPENQKLQKDDDALYCDSWRFSVETNNAGVWRGIPAKCIRLVEEYLTGDRYVSDCGMVSNYSLSFANGVKIAGDGKDAWVFDIDETLLSCIPYYVAHGFGIDDYNVTDYEEWLNLAIVPAIPASLEFYKEIKSLGFQVILLTGRTEDKRNVTVKNLLFAGYDSWEKLILRGTDDESKTALVYKSEKRAELEAEGYRFHGNTGDQWSDLFGSPIASRSFKLPNPMYYVV